MRLSANAEKVQGIYYSAHRCATCAAVCLTGCTCKCTTQDSCPVESAMPECKQWMHLLHTSSCKVEPIS